MSDHGNRGEWVNEPLPSGEFADRDPTRREATKPQWPGRPPITFDSGTERACWRAPAGPGDDFHVCGLIWNEDAVVWYCDEVAVHRVRDLLHQYPLSVRLDLEAQAYYRANPREDPLPADLLVDYVRTWQRMAPEKP